ncbi:hypothetical protein K0M31_020405 [Melipona bicolor]|uniref:Uncharacterized protein n=1 Tax=Melipona bicolor TaxID=60889 RepID=A0AA40G1Z4_9HYME|nr:hypothetical protein K0M31_020405 [Melipona bicolor]
MGRAFPVSYDKKLQHPGKRRCNDQFQEQHWVLLLSDISRVIAQAFEWGKSRYPANSIGMFFQLEQYRVDVATFANSKNVGELVFWEAFDFRQSRGRLS